MSCWVNFGLQELLQDQECRDTFNLGVTAAHTPYDVGQDFWVACHKAVLKPNAK